jgi:paraquat-inducible protein B
MTTAQAEVKEGRGFNAIWIIPIVALLLGIYMVVHTWMTEGPEITLAFDTAEGLVAGKTKVKYRNVEMGLVTEVFLTDDFEGVKAKVKMDLQAKPLLKSDTQFWVVTARVGVGNISGLDTLLSGAYIQMAPGANGQPNARDFVALPQPPLTPADAPGIRLRLLSDRAGSVSTGDSVVYKGYKVGRVDHSEFDTDLERMRYEIFIDAPFHDLIDSSVRFYNTSGVSLSASAEGLELRTGSLDTVLLGGVAFDRPPDVPPGGPVETGTEFDLYESYEATLENPFRYGRYYVVLFSQSLKGLLPGAPVEYRGIPIGRVDRIMMRELIESGLVEQAATGKVESTGRAIPVRIYIEPGRLTLPDTPQGLEILEKSIHSGVVKGMRATLETGNLLTGARYVGIDYYPNVEDEADVGMWGDYETIPAIGGGVQQVMVKVNSILDKIDRAPIEETLVSVNDTVAQLDKALVGLQGILNSDDMQRLPEDLGRTLEELRQTLDGLSPDSELYENMNSSMRQLNRTLNNLEALTRTLSGQPNAAIMGSKLPPDPQPQAR